MNNVYLSRPFKTRNADEFDLSQILTLFINPLSGLISPFEFENTIIKGKMGSGKTMFLRANHAYYLYNLVPKIIDKQELILPVFIRLSDFQHIKKPSEIYKAIIIKIIEELSSIFIYLQDAQKMSRIHLGIKPLLSVLLSNQKISNTLSQLSKLGAEEYIQRITTDLGFSGGVKAKFLDISAKFNQNQLHEFRAKPNPGIKDVEEAYKNLIEDCNGKILLLIDEAGSLDRKFFQGKENDSFFEILMNQFRTASYIRAKIAIYPNSYQDVLTETRYGDVIKLEENVIDDAGYKKFREKIYDLMKNYLSQDDTDITPEQIFEINREKIYGDCIEQIINASDGNVRRLIQLLDLVMNEAFNEHKGNNKITLGHTINALKANSRNIENIYTETDRQFLLNVQQICKNRGTYKFQFPNMSIALNRFTSKSQEYNLLKVVEIGTGNRGSTYAFDYSYCVANDIPTHYIVGSEKLNRERTMLNGKWINRTARVSSELIQHACITSKIEGIIDFVSDNAGFIKDANGERYFFQKDQIIEEDKNKLLFKGKAIRFVPSIIGEGAKMAQVIEIL